MLTVATFSAHPVKIQTRTYGDQRWLLIIRLCIYIITSRLTTTISIVVVSAIH